MLNWKKFILPFEKKEKRNKNVRSINAKKGEIYYCNKKKKCKKTTLEFFEWGLPTISTSESLDIERTYMDTPTVTAVPGITKVKEEGEELLNLIT